MFGKSDEQKQLEEQKREQQRSRRHTQATQAMQQAQEDQQGGGEALKQLSEIDDLADFPGKTLQQFISKVTSTSNLSKEDIESSRWIRQYIKILYLSRFPERDGLKGHVRAYAFGDRKEHRKPLDESAVADIEAFTHMSNLATTRSEDFKASQESLRTIAESYVRSEEQESSGGGGILGRVGLR